MVGIGISMVGIVMVRILDSNGWNSLATSSNREWETWLRNDEWKKITQRAANYS